MSFIKACSLADLWIGEMKSVNVGGRAVLLLNWGGRISAYENRCCHLGVPLSQGSLKDGKLVCRAHGWEFDPSTGHGINPATVHLKTYLAKADDGAIWVDTEVEHST